MSLFLPCALTVPTGLHIMSALARGTGHHVAYADVVLGLNWQEGNTEWHFEGSIPYAHAFKLNLGLVSLSILFLAEAALALTQR